MMWRFIDLKILCFCLNHNQTSGEKRLCNCSDFVNFVQRFFVRVFFLNNQRSKKREVYSAFEKRIFLFLS